MSINSKLTLLNVLILAFFVTCLALAYEFSRGMNISLLHLGYTKTLLIVTGVLAVLIIFLAGFIARVIQKDYSKMKDMSLEIKKLATFPERNPDPIIELNSNLEVVYANPAFKLYFPSLNLDERFQNEVNQHSLRHVKQAFKDKRSCSFDMKYERRWYNFYVSYLELNDQETVRIFGRDITLQKDTQVRFELTTQGAHIGLWDWSILNNEVYFSNEWFSILGYEPGELLQAFETFEMLCHPDDFENAMTHLNEHVEGKRDEYKLPIRMKHKDGHYIWVLTTGQVSEYSNDDKPLRASGIHLDITDRVKAEQALIDANAELEEFAYRTSHDLRSPLVSSIGLLDVLEESVKSGKPEQAQKSLEHIRGSLEKLERLVQDILALTRAKNKDEEDQDIDVSNMIEESIEKFSHMQGFRRLKIHTDLNYKETLLSKKDRVALIVENLISNAIKYQDPDIKNPYIRIDTYEENEHFVLEVSDNGLGIPKEQQDKMFTMFKRFHPKVSFGSGLGLYMMKKSADLLGGELSFEPQEKGCFFRFKLPQKGSEQDG